MTATVLMSTYRVDTTPPPVFSLVAGELYVEVLPSGGGVPRLWVGTPAHLGFSGDIALLVSGTPKPEPSVITVDPIDNPSSSAAVHITGTVAPGAVIELAALAGTNEDYLEQVNPWSPWDASAGTFDTTWWLPPRDTYRVRVRMRDDPQTFVDSNLFAVTE